MKLPNGHQAIVDIRKLTDYCLNPDHPRGKHKARVFASALGLTAMDAVDLRNALLDAATMTEATRSSIDEFGERFVIDFLYPAPSGGATIRSTWIIRSNEDFPRLTSCYVL